jgi:hypothetical protein
MFASEEFLKRESYAGVDAAHEGLGIRNNVDHAIRF